MSLLSFLRELPQRLTRVTSGGKMIREVDGLRFLAITPVVIMHLSERVERNAQVAFQQGAEWETSQFLMHRGSVGVFLFFMISGFILGMPFAAHYLNDAKQVSIKNYFLRRLTRLEPPYIIVLTVIAIYLIVIGGETIGELGPHYLASLFYVHSLVFWDFSPIDPPIWTLEIEVQFYILAPILAAFFFSIQDKVKRRLFNGGVFLFIMLMQQYFMTFIGEESWTILGHLHYFLVGFFLADVYLTDWKNGTAIVKSSIYNYIAVLAFAGMFLTWSWDFQWFSRLGFVVCLFVLGYSVFKATWANRFISLPWITAIGGMCYTIYLLHLPIIEALIRFTSPIVFTNIFALNIFVQGLILIPIVLVFSIIYFLLIEKPCMHKDWPKKLKAALFPKKEVVS